MWQRFSALLLCLSFLTGATFTWTNPTTRTDGSPLTNHAGTRLYWGQQSGGPYQNLLADIAAPSASHEEPDANVQGRFFVATAYDTNGFEGPRSNEASPGGAPPPQVGDLVVQLSPLSEAPIVAAIDHAFAEQNTNQTTTDTAYADITGAAIASGSFTAGKKYLLYVTAQIGGDTDASGVGIQLLHGTTAFAESELLYETVNAGERYPYAFFTVWTAVSGEGVKLQSKAITGGTASADQIAIFAMNLSDDLTENTDWAFAERATDDALSTTPLDGASVTMTPGEASDWLVLTRALVSSSAENTSPLSDMSSAGDVTETQPFGNSEPRDTAATRQFTLARVFSLTAQSNTFKERSYTDSGTAHTRLHSSVFILNLNKFKNHAFAWTETAAALSATNYATELASIGITPDVEGDVWIGAFWVFDKQAVNRVAEFRVQVDGADQPAGQETDNYQLRQGADNGDEDPMILSTVVSLTAAAHTIDLDASVNSATSAPEGEDRLLWAVTMELAAAAGTIGPAGAIESGEAFGTAKLMATLAPPGIASGEAVGAQRLVALLQPAGIASGETFGSHRMVAVLSPTGIASGEAVGATRLIGILAVSGIPSAEGFGSAKLVAVLAPSGIPTAEAVGTPTLPTLNTIAPTGIPSGEAFGSARLLAFLVPSGVPSGAAFGVPGLRAVLLPSGIPSGEVVSTAALHAILVGVGGIPSAEALGLARMVARLAPSGITSAEALGLARFVGTLAPAGIASTEAFGLLRFQGLLEIGEVLVATLKALLPRRTVTVLGHERSVVSLLPRRTVKRL